MFDKFLTVYMPLGPVRTVSSVFRSKAGFELAHSVLMDFGEHVLKGLLFCRLSTRVCRKM